MRKNNLTYIKKLLAAAALMCATAILGGCGDKKIDPVDTQLGVDGYVYVPQKISSISTMDFMVTGNYLYYLQDSSISKVTLTAAEGTDDQELEPDFSTKKTLARVKSYIIPAKTEEYPEESEDRIINDLRDIILSSGKNRYFFSLSTFTTDSEQNLYYFVEANAGDSVTSPSGSVSLNTDPIGGMLYKQAPDGTIIYALSLPSADSLAVGKKGYLYALTDKGIQIIDEQGRLFDLIDISKYQQQISSGFGHKGTLLGDSEGHVYYTITNSNLTRTVLVIGGSSPEKFTELSALANTSGSSLSMSANGNLLIMDQNSDVVSEYNLETSDISLIFRWEDVNYHGSNFYKILRLSPGRLLANYIGGENTGLYLLTKTSVDELPKKELVVLASLSPVTELKEAVVNFNRENPQYHVIIESYGSDADVYSREKRLDATLVSSTPPDLLDLHAIYKYANQGLLDDLTPYLTASTQVPLDDFLDNLLEGYTIDGRLICVPTQFSLSLVCGRASQLESMGFSEGWTMEDVYALTEAYPDSFLLHTGTQRGAMDKQRILEYFCSTYFLNKFVDWESGTCSFDSEEFLKMLTWLDEHSGIPANISPDPVTGHTMVYSTYIPENSLLTMNAFNDFKVDLVSLEYQFKEKVRLMGVPTVDGSLRGRTFPHDSIGLLSNARNKEGAWAFLEYYLSKNKIRKFGGHLPTRKSMLESMFESAITPPPTDADGNYIMGSSQYFFSVDNEELQAYYFTPRQQAEDLLNAIMNTDFSPLPDKADAILDVVLEEMDSYYNADKELKEVIKIIQNRAQLILDESK